MFKRKKREEKQKPGKPGRKKDVEIKKSASRKFVIALSIVSMIGFLSIVLESLFFIDMNPYIETLWLVVLGVGLILESSLKDFKKVKKKGLTSEYLGKLTMMIVGGIAVIAGLLSLPQLDVQHASFFAVKGIVSLLAIIFIIFQTWVTE
jgi:hypothetical protein